MWRTAWLWGIACAVLGGLLAGRAAAQTVTDDEVDRAIERGCRYFIKMQKPDGTWQTHKLGHHANTVMCMLALAYAEWDPKSDVMKGGLKALLEADIMGTGPQSYLTAFRIQGLAKLLNQVDRESRERVLKLLKEDTQRLIEGQTDVGGWNYDLAGGGNALGDFSNVQIAVLGLGEAIKAGLELPKEPLLKVQMLYIDKQQPDGGWNYGRQVHKQWPWTTADNQQYGTYGSMTAAGVASLYITRDYLYRGMGCPCRGGRSGYRRNKVDMAIDKALAWLAERFDAKTNPKGSQWNMYWLYSCERVGLASGIKYFGAHNWYAEGARVVLDGQRPDGSWGHVIRDGHWNSSTGAAWAILFLIKGRAPILMNKLQFEGSWNLHPQDLKNLARYVGGVKEQTFAWQVINLDAPVDEWHDAPILYITPESIIKLTDEHRAKLRKFTDDGGTILFEASCGNSTIRSWWQAAAAKIWPEFEFRRVDKDHPVWQTDVKITRQVRGLQEMSDGVRTFIFYAPNDISCAWNTNAVARRVPEFHFGLNLYAYATDRAKIRSRLARATSAKSGQAGLKQITVQVPRPLTVARMKHGGDWHVTQRYRLVEKLAGRLSGDDAALRVTPAQPAAPSSAEFPAGGVFYATGRGPMTLSEPEQAALKKRLAAGGFLIVDATLGDARFQEAFPALAGQMGWTVKRFDDKHPIVSGTMPGGTGHDLTTRIKYTYAALARARSPLRLDLRGLWAGDRLVGVYSPRDLMFSQAGLRAWGSVGYDEASARRIVENLILYATTTGAPSAGQAAPETPAPETPPQPGAVTE